MNEKTIEKIYDQSKGRRVTSVIVYTDYDSVAYEDPEHTIPVHPDVLKDLFMKNLLVLSRDGEFYRATEMHDGYVGVFGTIIAAMVLPGALDVVPVTVNLSDVNSTGMVQDAVSVYGIFTDENGKLTGRFYESLNEEGSYTFYMLRESTMTIISEDTIGNGWNSTISVDGYGYEPICFTDYDVTIVVHDACEIEVTFTPFSG